MKQILIFLDKTTPTDLSLIGASERMVNRSEAWITAVGYPSHLPLGPSVYDEVLTLDETKVPSFDTQAITHQLQSLCQAHAYDIILMPATLLGRILAPRLAIALHAGLVADVTDLVVHDDQLEMIRPAYSGKLMAQIIKTSPGPHMMTIRPHSFQPTHIELRPTQIRPCPLIPAMESNIILMSTRQKTATEDIRDAKILISGGGGVLERFDRLDELAKALNAQVSASRRVVDSGVVHRKIQVGQSGKTVSPKLYIALGISGSVQHIEGLRNVETILAVNTNKHAPICSLAALVVEGDAIDFIDKLCLKIKNPV